MNITRLADHRLIDAAADPRLQGNVNGPSMLKVPEWVTNPLGRYYLYYAHHNGPKIQLAFANDLIGPWQLYEPGALQLAGSGFTAVPPKEADWHPEFRAWLEIGGDTLVPHIASPDVIEDAGNRDIRMYYHGRLGDGRQGTKVALSPDGLNFTPQPGILGGPYMRVFRHDDAWFGIAIPGKVYRSADGLRDFEHGTDVIDPKARHCALYKHDDRLYIFWTRVGDSPEHILMSTLDLRPDWREWKTGPATSVLRPERDWEGVREPNLPSKYGLVMHDVHELRDPYIYEEEGRLLLFYSTAGEQGLGLAEITGLISDS
jgi:hypothetical protein